MPMNLPDLTPAEERLLWEEAARRLSRVDTSPTVSMEEVDRVLARLPSSRDAEGLIDRLRRVAEQGTAPDTPFAVFQLDDLGDGHVLLDDTDALRNQLQRFSIAIADAANDDRFASRTDVPRLAAADTDSKDRPPEPELVLESEDGRFRVRIRHLQGKVELGVEALGMAVDELAGCRVGLFSASGDGVDET